MASRPTHLRSACRPARQPRSAYPAPPEKQDNSPALSPCNASARLRRRYCNDLLLRNAGKIVVKCTAIHNILAALRTSAVSSTNAGGLPAPAPIPRFPEERTAVTTPGPPVAAIRWISLCFIIIALVSRVGFSTVTAILAGPPASREASFNRLIAKSMF